MDRFAVDELDFESVEPCRPSSFDGTSSFKFDVGIRARQALEGIHLRPPPTVNKDPRLMDWKFLKKVKDVKVHRVDEYTHNMQATRLSFRLSCEVKATLESIVNVLAPTTTHEYMRVEKRVFPKLLQCAVLQQGSENSHNIDPTDFVASFPRHCIKWHGSHLLTSRLTGRLGTPNDFVFEEYVEYETWHGRPRCFGYMQSVDSAEDELKKLFPVKCKRGAIRKGAFLVAPVDDQCMTHEVSIMYVLDFPKSFGVSSERVIAAYVDRLINMREVLFNTLFQAIKILPRHKWVDDRSRQHCAVCESQFTLVWSRHHCRACGEVICHNCSRKWSIPIQDAGELLTRLCTPCSLRARSHLMPAAPVTGPAGIGMRLSRTHATLNSLPPSSLDLEDFDYNDVIHSMHDSALHRPMYSMPYKNSGSGAAFRNGSRITTMLQPSALDNGGHVRVGTAMSSSSETAHAVSDAWEKMVCMLQQEKPHFVFVQYSCDHNTQAIVDTLKKLHPDVVFCGHSIGVLGQDAVLFQEEAFVRHTHVLSLWGLWDIDGNYATAAGSFKRPGVDPATTSAPLGKEETRQAVKDAIRKLHLGPTESPDFVWLVPSEGYEDVVIDTVSAMLDTSLSTVGASARHSRLCGMAHEAHVFDQDDPSVVLAMCSPSVQVAHAYFTCYDQNDRVFTVGKADGKRLMLLDNQPPLGLLKDGLDRSKRKLYLDSKVFPAFGRVQKKEKSLQLIEPVAIHSDLSMTLSAPVARGDQVCLMSMDRKAIPIEIAARIRQGRQELDVVGCLVSCSASIVQHLGDDFDLLRTAVQNGLGKDPSIAITGSLSMCQLGVVSGAHHLSHSNGMVAALMITTKRKKNWRPRMAHRKSF
ncbi:hypothetical protein H310_05113 [Aphanomyces invadans]|uniref:FYVE-type domain-containing protein n=1 Tax=Aphanomyces invadans TaxID=157072 RepID=A0A024UBU1_9STRA|nr:hypothetical protein H310_05113 [Aphanomyces invadans]ETW03744.1 hypothetical protein H310_05113 [Aphanomyces invadans]|eukprot:XP_008867973.1 hypothetical protein H310_05113 [Aphanomyces invadans]